MKAPPVRFTSLRAIPKVELQVPSARCERCNGRFAFWFAESALSDMFFLHVSLRRRKVFN